jgi:excisionase family DNA binding protein
MTAGHLEPCLTDSDVCAVLSVTERELAGLAESGALRPISADGRRWPVSKVEALLNSRPGVCSVSPGRLPKPEPPPGMQESDESDEMTTAEVAEAFRVSRETVSRWGSKGILALSYTKGGRRRYSRKQVRGFVPLPGSDTMTVAEVAKEFEVTDNTIGNWTDDGFLTVFYTPGGQRRYSREQVRDRKEKAPAGPRRSTPNPG